MLKRAFSLVALAGILQLSFAQDFALKDSLREIEIIAPISILQPLAWPGAFFQMDEVDIQRGNGIQLAEQLNTVPGVMMQQGTLSTNRLTIRGIGSRTPYNSNRIKAYWGEIPLTDGDGVTALEDFSLNDIGSLQVVKGPSSALYGAGLGGVILINPWPENPLPLLSLRSEAASFGTLSTQTTIGLHQRRTNQIVLTAGHVNTNGWRQNSEFARYNAILKARFLSGKHTWHALYHFRFLNGQIPSSIDSIDFANDPSRAAANWLAAEGYEKGHRQLMSIGAQSPISSSIVNHVSLFGGQSALNEKRPFNRLNEERWQIGFRDKLLWKHRNWRANAGLEAMMERTNYKLLGVEESNLGNLLTHEHIRHSYLNVFAGVEWQAKAWWQIHASVNVNTTQVNTDNQLNTTESEQHRFSPVASPRIGTNIELRKGLHVFASVGHGFSMPSLEESLLPDGSLNAAIQAEEGVSYDAGLRYQSPSMRTTAEVTVYFMNMKNLLVTKRESEDIFYGINAGATEHKGVELTVRQVVYSNDRQYFDMQLSGFTSQNLFTDFVDDGHDFRGNHLPGIPAYNLAVNLHAKSGQWQAWVDFKAFGSQYLTDDNSRNYQAYSKSGIKMSYAFKSVRLPLQLHLGADNLLNTKYASMVLINAPSFGSNLPRYYYPGLPFNMYGGITIAL